MTIAQLLPASGPFVEEFPISKVYSFGCECLDEDEVATRYWSSSSLTLLKKWGLAQIGARYPSSPEYQNT